MIIRSLKFSTKLVLILSILSILSFLSLFAWIITGPRSLSSITPTIEKELSSISENIDVKISGSYIKWDEEEHSIVIEARDINVIGKDEVPIARLPKITFDFSVLKFLSGNILSSGITIINPSLYIDVSKKSFYTASDSPEKKQKNLHEGLLEVLKSGTYNFPINSVRIKNAELFISNGFSDFVWHAKDGYLRINENSKIISELNLNVGTNQVYVGAEVFYKDDTYDNTIKFKNLPSHIVSDIFPKNDFLKKIDVESAGNVKFLVSESGEVSQAIFNISNLNGNFSIEEFFPEKFNISGASLSGSFYNNFATMTLDSFNAKLDKSIVFGSGSFSNLIPSPDFSPLIEANVTVKNFEVNDLYKYWPIKLGKKVRSWVTGRIADGKVGKATADFKFTPEYFDKIRSWKKGGKKWRIPSMDDEAIDAVIEVKGASVNYHDDFPTVKDASAKVKFTGKSMSAEVSNAKILNSSVKNANVFIADMYQKNAIIKVDGEFDGRASDGSAFLKAVMRNQKETGYLKSIYNSTGLANGKVDLSLPITKNLSYNKILIDIDSDFSGVKLPEFINGHDISKSDFNLKLKNKKLDIKGNATILEMPLSISYKSDFDRVGEVDYSVSGKVTADKLKKLDIATIPFVENDIGVNVKIRQRQDVIYINGEADISDSMVAIPRAAFTKDAKKKGNVVFVSKKYSDGTFEVKNFVASGDDFSVNGNFYIKNSQIARMNVKNAKYNGSDYSMNYSLIKNKHVMDIKGKVINLSDVSFGDFFKGGKDNEVASIDLKADFKTVHMKNSEKFLGFTANINCSKEQCSSINAYAKISGDGFIALSVKPIGKNLSVMLESDNAGSAIKAFGVSKHIKGGRLTVESTFSKNAGGTIAQGLIQIHDFTAIKTPILGKLLTLASLKGITDLLNNKGIAFKRFAAPFHLSHSVITLHDAKTAGSSIGITSKGTVDMRKGEVDLSGAIVPAYEVNKLLGNIPIVGNLLVGKKNEGVIATKYRVKGPFDDVKITVNPLTILTPGFLRNIFDIF